MPASRRPIPAGVSVMVACSKKRIPGHLRSDGRCDRLAVAQSGCNCADTGPHGRSCPTRVCSRSRLYRNRLPGRTGDLYHFTGMQPTWVVLLRARSCQAERRRITRSPSSGNPDRRHDFCWRLGVGQPVPEPAEVRIPILDGSAHRRAGIRVQGIGSDLFHHSVSWDRPSDGIGWVRRSPPDKAATRSRWNGPILHSGMMAGPRWSTPTSQGCSGSAQLDVVLTTSFHAAGP